MTCRNLTYEDRKILEKLYANGLRLPDLADILNVHLATIYRELSRGDTGEMDSHGRSGYNTEKAQRLLKQNLKKRGKRRVTNGQ